MCSAGSPVSVGTEKNGWVSSGRRRIGKFSGRGFLIDSILVVQEREGLARVLSGVIIMTALRVN